MFRPHNILKFIIPLLIFGALIFFSNTAPAGMTRRAGWFIIKPVANFVTGAENKLSGSAASEDNGRLTAALFEIEELRRRLKELEQAFRFKEEERLSLVGARVILYTRELGGEYLIVDRGRKDGAREGDLVLTSEHAVVGKIRGVEDSFSKVSLASNSGEAFEAEILPIRTTALAKGLGAGTFSLELVPSDSPVKRGDFAALFGRTAIILGEIVYEKSSLTNAFKDVKAVLLVKPEELREVFIPQ